MLGADGTGLREEFVAGVMLSEAEGASVAATPGATAGHDIELGLVLEHKVCSCIII